MDHIKATEEDIQNKRFYIDVEAFINSTANTSDKEYLDLERYCRDNHIIFEGMEITKKPKGNVEEFFRNEREIFIDGLVLHSFY